MNILDHLTFEPAEYYHAQAKANNSSHQVINFLKSPLLWRKHDLGLIPNSQSTEFLIGAAGHVRILEGRAKYDELYTANCLFWCQRRWIDCLSV